MRAVCIRKKDGGGHTLVNGEGERILALVILSMFPRKVAFTTCRSKDRTAQVAANLSKACVPNVVSRLVVGLYTFERLRFDVDRASIRANRFTRLCARIMGTHASYTRISAFGDWRRVWSLLIVSRIILIPLNERIRSWIVSFIFNILSNERLPEKEVSIEDEIYRIVQKLRKDRRIFDERVRRTESFASVVYDLYPLPFFY